jgi:hypothetical protein
VLKSDKTNRRVRLKVLNFYGGAGIDKSTIAADETPLMKIVRDDNG